MSRETKPPFTSLKVIRQFPVIEMLHVSLRSPESRCTRQPEGAVLMKSDIESAKISAVKIFRTLFTNSDRMPLELSSSTKRFSPL